MKKKILLIVGGILILSVGIILIPKGNTKINNNEPEINLTNLETNPDLDNNNTATFIADKTESLTKKEIVEKYDIPIFEEKENTEINNKETKEFKEIDFSKNENNLDLIELETEPETQAINLDSIEINNITDTYTSSTSENIVPVVASPEPTTPEPTQATEPEQTETQEPETQIETLSQVIENSIYTISNDEITAIENKGLELLQLAGQNGININGIDNSIKVMTGEAYFAPNGVEKYIRIYPENDYYNIDIFVSVNPEKSSLNNLALKELCKLVSYNNNNVFDCIMNDYMNEVYNSDIWNDTEYNFKIKYYGDKEQHLTRYSIKY